MTTLVLLRHAATDWTERRLIQGRADRTLSAAGRAEAAGWRLPAAIAGFDVWSSPLARCVETARILAGEPRIELRLAEADWGDWEGRSLAELRQADPDGMAAAEARGLDLLPPGGESPRQVQDRLRPWLAELAAAGRPALAVTHKGVIRAAYALATGWDMTGDPPEKPRDGNCHIFRLGPAGAIAVERVNVPMAIRDVVAPSPPRGEGWGEGARTEPQTGPAVVSAPPPHPASPRGGEGQQNRAKWKILVHVQHLLGIGHVRRAALIARALVEAGAEVTVAEGGFPVAGADFGRARVVPLPPARVADASFRPILDEAGRPIDDAWRQRRRAMLLALLDEVRPDALILETFPFGRRAFRFELLPLLEAAAARRPRPLVVSSVRDILVAKDAEKERQMAEWADRWIDQVLVHGDARVIPFGATFAHADRLAGRLCYTGYVAPPRPAVREGTDGTDEIIVSVGGGAVGERLLRASLAASRLGGLSALRWRLLAGPDLPAATFGNLARSAPAHAVIERARPDFPALLRRCRLSVSQAGYNTVVDLLAAGCRSVLVPFAAGSETEQATRAALLAARGLATVIDEATLTPVRLADGIAAALRAPPPATPAIAMDGAAEAARIVLEALDRRLPEKPASGL